MKKLIIIIFGIIILFSAIFFCQKANAYTFGTGEFSLNVNPTTSFGEGETGTSAAISRIFNITITVSEVIFIILLLIGGIMYLTALGNDEQVGKARKLMLEAVIGIVIVLAAWALGTFIIGRLKQGGGSLIPTPTSGSTATGTALPSPTATTVVTPPPTSPGP